MGSPEKHSRVGGLKRVLFGFGGSAEQTQGNTSQEVVHDRSIPPAFNQSRPTHEWDGLIRAMDHASQLGGTGSFDASVRLMSLGLAPFARVERDQQAIGNPFKLVPVEGYCRPIVIPTPDKMHVLIVVDKAKTEPAKGELVTV